MKSTKKKQKQWNQHISYIIIFIYIDFQAGKKKKKKKKSPWYGLGSNHKPLVYKANFSYWLNT